MRATGVSPARLLAAAACVALAAAACPNKCNGHGRCINIGQCQCYGMWTGADCSLREFRVGRGVGARHVWECIARRRARLPRWGAARTNHGNGAAIT